jgi:hypothetical protein
MQVGSTTIEAQWTTEKNIHRCCLPILQKFESSLPAKNIKELVTNMLIHYMINLLVFIVYKSTNFSNWWAQP